MVYHSIFILLLKIAKSTQGRTISMTVADNKFTSY